MGPSWEGAEGGTMVRLDGVAYSRFVGLELDGRGKASVGFHYQATRGCWYGARPDPQLSPAATLLAVGNEYYGAKLEGGDPVMERTFFTETPTDATLAKVSRALDALRRLGEADLRLNHP